MHLSRLLTFAVACVFACGACGSGKSSSEHPTSSTSSRASTNTAGTALPRTRELQGYCNLAYRYFGVTAKIDWSNVESAMVGLETAAPIAKAWADSAPEELRAAQHDLAASNDDLIVRLRQRAPKTLAEFQNAANDANTAIKKRYPNLDRDTQRVQAFDHTNCGMESG